MRPNAYEAFAAACALERAAWELVKDRLPGTPGFEEAPWLEWRAAVRLSDAARRGLTDVVTGRSASRWPLREQPELPLAQEPGSTPGPVRPIQPGDVVRLKGNGAPMNVRSISDSRVMCTWFDLEGHRRVDVFRLDAVELLHDLSGLDDRRDPS